MNDLTIISLILIIIGAAGLAGALGGVLWGWGFGVTLALGLVFAVMSQID